MTPPSSRSCSIPDGRLFVERLGRGMEVLAELEPVAAEIIIGSVAHALQTEAASAATGSRDCRAVGRVRAGFLDPPARRG
jgi:hypothetical protein